MENEVVFWAVLCLVALLGLSSAMELGTNCSDLDETDLNPDEILFNLDEDNFIDEPVFQDLLFRIFEEDPSLLELDEEHHFTRDRPTKIDYWETNWGLMLRNPDTDLGHTKAGKIFRRRFRVPKPVFDIIVQKSKSVNLFGVSRSYLERVPIEFKILMALRILGRGNCADDIAEMSYGCASSINVFFKTFVAEFVKNFYDEFVKIIN